MMMEGADSGQGGGRRAVVVVADGEVVAMVDTARVWGARV
jgi:hypothetical protein